MRPVKPERSQRHVAQAASERQRVPHPSPRSATTGVSSMLGCSARSATRRSSSSWADRRTHRSRRRRSTRRPNATRPTSRRLVGDPRRPDARPRKPGRRWTAARARPWTRRSGSASNDSWGPTCRGCGSTTTRRHTGSWRAPVPRRRPSARASTSVRAAGPLAARAADDSSRTSWSTRCRTTRERCTAPRIRRRDCG